MKTAETVAPKTKLLKNADGHSGRPTAEDQGGPLGMGMGMGMGVGPRARCIEQCESMFKEPRTHVKSFDLSLLFSILFD